MNAFNFSNKLITRDLVLKLSVNNVHECPKLLKATVSLSNKFISSDKLVVLPYFLALLLWSGQRPSLLRAKKSVATFHLKKNSPFGCFVTLRRDSLANFFEKICLILFPKLQPNTQKNCASFQENRVDFGLNSFLKCTEVEPNTDLFDFLEGCSCSLETTCLSVKQTQIFLSGFHFPVFKKTEI
jgi:large subunit ribosomal protein L5